MCFQPKSYYNNWPVSPFWLFSTQQVLSQYLFYGNSNDQNIIIKSEHVTEKSTLWSPREEYNGGLDNESLNISFFNQGKLKMFYLHILINISSL